MHFQISFLVIISSLFTLNLAKTLVKEDNVELEIRGCKNFGRCCTGRNSSCFASNKVKAENGSEHEWKNCYCDEECVVTGDCCHDHNDFCKAVDCEVSRWSHWSSCSRLCGHGNQTRTRSITAHPLNGGVQCPALVQHRNCIGSDCNIKRDVSRKSLRETGRVLPIRYAMYRTSTKYDIRKGIRKNLYDYYLSQNSILSRPTYCATYVISYSRPHCRRPRYGKWAKELRRGNRMCVECQASAMHGNGRCRGDGTFNRDTRWKAVGVPACSGWWTMVTRHKECNCNAQNEKSLIFV